MDARELRLTMTLANPFKEGDLPVGGTRDDRVRDEARRALGAVTLRAIRRTPLVGDGVSEALARSLDGRLADELDALTARQLAERLLARGGPAWIARHRDGLTSEALAAAAKLLSDDELSRVARGVFNPLPGEGVAPGAPRHFGSRIQPNSPGDSDEEILFSVLEGLAHGCGDVVIGLNPASDGLETIVRLEALLQGIVERLGLPTRYCVLSDMPKQHAARASARVDVGFQSLAGTSSALAGMVGLDVDGLLELAGAFGGLYFETGQGSAVTNGAAESVDMVTLESRAYGLARLIARRTGAWTIVNDVAGFIGPEVFRTPAQLERACLEDAFMAKAHGLTMGLDVCATFHMGIDPGTLRRLTGRIADRAAPAYLMAVAGNADPMLGYLTTSFREHPRLRRQLGCFMTSAMQARLTALGVLDGRGEPAPSAEATAGLYAEYAKAGGDARTREALVAEGLGTLGRLRERGFELGRGPDPAGAGSQADARVDAIYAHARQALYAALSAAVLRDAAPDHATVRTLAADRDDYLAHPPRGERIRPEDADALRRLPGPPPQVAVAISDGLNANAVNENLRAVLPPLRRRLRDAGVQVGGVDVVIRNGRVRAGYHAGELTGAEALVHFIGERPGSGLDTLSAYLTYGRDAAGRLRWSPSLDHSCTTAVCGIHPRGRAPDVAVEDVARAVTRMLATRTSGVRPPPDR